MPKNHIMIDLETMGTGFNAAIVSIGAVRFGLDPREEIGEPDFFYTNVDLQSCINDGGQVTASAIMWWLKQSEQARQALAENPKRIFEALESLEKFVHGTKPLNGIWSHKEFDAQILTWWYSNSGPAGLPWSHRVVYDLRTTGFLYPKEFLEAYEKVDQNLKNDAHNALSDAIKQAEILRMVLSWKKPEEAGR